MQACKGGWRSRFHSTITQGHCCSLVGLQGSSWCSRDLETSNIEQLGPRWQEHINFLAEGRGQT